MRKALLLASMDFATVKDKLQEAGVVCDPGLTEAEVRLAEESFGFQFPPDLKAGPGVVSLR